jgi:4'-phosphopantetheinyl transferase EntD
LFSAGVVAEVATAADYLADLYPEEARAARRMIPQRRQEFTAGRACARRALARLGVRDFQLLPGSRREPRWPEGIVGSIAHCAGFAGVVAARRGEIDGLGLDAEPIQTFDPALLQDITSPHERDLFETLPSGTDWGSVAFVVKEAFFKAVYPVLRAEIGFAEIEIAAANGGVIALRPGPSAGDAVRALLPAAVARVAVRQGLVLAGVSLSRSR